MPYPTHNPQTSEEEGIDLHAVAVVLIGLLLMVALIAAAIGVAVWIWHDPYLLVNLLLAAVALSIWTITKHQQNQNPPANNTRSGRGNQEKGKNLS